MLNAYLHTKSRLMDWRDRLAALKSDDNGAALIEYALVIGLVAVVAVTALTALQGQISTALGSIGGHLSTIK
jgi:Flp pilus assembly pilin Flp